MHRSLRRAFAMTHLVDRRADATRIAFDVIIVFDGGVCMRVCVCAEVTTRANANACSGTFWATRFRARG